MDRKRIWGWWFFDWASQPYATLLTTFIFAPYFAEIAQRHYVAIGHDAGIAGAHAQALWGYGASVVGVVIAVLAPILGAVADTSGRRMIWVWIFSALYVLGAAGLWFVTPDSPPLLLAVTLYGIGLIGAEFATIFTNALLPGLAPRAEIGRLSGSGYAFGYAGGLVALAIMLAFFADNATTGLTLLGQPPALGLDGAAREGTRMVGPLSALWYIVFMIPFFLWVREPRLPVQPVRLRAALSDLWALLRSLPRRVSLSAWLLSSMLSRDALNGLYAFGGVYAALVLGWPITLVGAFGIVSGLAAAIISWIGGRADRRYGPKPVTIVSTLVLTLVCVIVVAMDRASLFGIPLPQGAVIGPLGAADAIFFLCGALIGGAGGVLQSAGRTMMVLHTTEERAAEGFGLYALSGKATSFLAPFAIAVATDLTGSQRVGVSPLIVIFLLSLVLLRWVKPQGEGAGQ